MGEISRINRAIREGTILGRKKEFPKKSLNLIKGVSKRKGKNLF